VQDFEGITPNLLARTIETVEGGGAVVMLISTLRSLTQLYDLTMDVHRSLRTESHQDVRGAALLPCVEPATCVGLQMHADVSRWQAAALMRAVHRLLLGTKCWLVSCA
jgi:Domain of unknown function (DUF1726)